LVSGGAFGAKISKISNDLKAGRVKNLS